MTSGASPDSIIEVNFDGLVGPSHNYAGLSLGNTASASNVGKQSRPRKAALQGLVKMRRMMALGLVQGVFLPHARPATSWLRKAGFSGNDKAVLTNAANDAPDLLRNAFSASSMWTANAATVSPAPDTADSRCHITIANLHTMLHRSIEAEETYGQLSLAFADTRYFAIHPPLPPGFSDEGAANAMRLATSHGAKGVEVLIHGRHGNSTSGAFPARQSRLASEAIARLHLLDPAWTIHAAQSHDAIQAGAFHNDVVAVTNENVILAHEQAYADSGALYDRLRALVPEVIIIEAPASKVSLADAVQSYLFNSQLVTLPDQSMALIAPVEAQENVRVAAWLKDITRQNTPISQVEFMNLRQSMRNGGGPACLRLRVPMSQNALRSVDARFLLNDRQADIIERVIERYWPQTINPDDLMLPQLWDDCTAARNYLLHALGFHPDELNA